MTYFIVFDVISPLRLIICLLCMFLLFLESAFGICLGCLLYSKLNIKLNRCAGGLKCYNFISDTFDKRDKLKLYCFR